MIIPLPELPYDYLQVEGPATNSEVPYSDVPQTLSPLAFPRLMDPEHDGYWPNVAGVDFVGLAPCPMQEPCATDVAADVGYGTEHIGNDGAATVDGIRNDPASPPFHPTSSSLFNALGDASSAKRPWTPIDASWQADVPTATPPPVAAQQTQPKASADVLSMEELTRVLLHSPAGAYPGLLEFSSPFDSPPIGICAPPLDGAFVSAFNGLSMNTSAMPYTAPMAPSYFASSPFTSSSSSSSWSLPSTPASSDTDAWSTSDPASPPAPDAASPPRSSGAHRQPTRKTKSSTQRKARLAALNALPAAPPPAVRTGRFRGAETHIHSSRNAQTTDDTIPPPVKLPGGCWKCADCAYSSPRRSDVRRHVRTHYAPLAHEFVCTGVAIARDDVRAVAERARCVETDDGTLWYGGCWTAFTRSESLRRHLWTRRGRRCVAGHVGAP